MRTDRPPLLVLASTYPRWQGDSQPGFVHELSRRLTDRFNVTVVAPHAPGSLRRETMDGVTVVRFRYAPSRLERLAYDGGILPSLKQRPWAWLLVPAFLASMYIACRRELERSECSLVHAHWIVPQGLIAVLARIFAGRPVRILCTSHGGDLFGLRGRVGTMLKRFVLMRADAVTVVSNAMRSTATTLEPRVRDIQVLPMGVDLEQRFTPGAEGRRESHRLLFVGRLVEKKGVAVLLDAFSLLLRENPSVTLDIVGDGPEKPALDSHIKRLNLQDHVKLVGSLQQEALPDRLRRATFLVMPSIEARDGDQEGFGLVQVEAMGCGCPVIASDLPAIRDVIVNGETGVLVPPNDAVLLQRAMHDLLHDPSRREQLAAAAMQRIRDRFDWIKVAAAYGRLLEGLERSSTSPKSAS